MRGREMSKPIVWKMRPNSRVRDSPTKPTPMTQMQVSAGFRIGGFLAVVVLVVMVVVAVVAVRWWRGIIAGGRVITTGDGGEEELEEEEYRQWLR